jgi:hypothetical protein
MAKNYIDNLSEETKKGMLEKAEQSIYPSFAPLGYRNVMDLTARESLSLILISGLVSCGHCGCALVAKKKKGKYVYYHCTGNKGKCQEPYAREEVLEKCFADLLKGLVFDDEVMDWVTEALHQSHADEKRFRDQAIAQLQAEHGKI